MTTSNTPRGGLTAAQIAGRNKLRATTPIKPVVTKTTPKTTTIKPIVTPGMTTTRLQANVNPTVQAPIGPGRMVNPAQMPDGAKSGNWIDKGLQPSNLGAFIDKNPALSGTPGVAPKGLFTNKTTGGWYNTQGQEVYKNKNQHGEYETVQKDAQGNMIQQVQDEYGNWGIPDQSAPQTDLDKAWSKVRGSYTDPAKFVEDNPEIASALGLDTENMPTSLDEYLKKMAESKAADTSYSEGQNAIASEIDQSQLDTARQQGQSAIAGTTALMAQGREGVMGSSKPQVVEQFRATTEKVMHENELRVKSAQNARDKAVRKLKEAQDQGDYKAIQALQDDVNNAEASVQEARIAEQNAANSAVDSYTKLAESQASIAQTEANTQKIQTETIQSNFTAMGESASTLSIGALTTMANNANIPYGQVVAMRDMAVLTAQLGKAKSQGEIDQITANIAKIQKDTELAGKPAEVLTSEWYLGLPKDQQNKILEYKNAGYQFMQIDNGDGTKSVIAGNQATGEGVKVYDGSIATGGEGITMDMIGNPPKSAGGTGGGYDYGDTSFITADNQKLANGKIGTPGVDIGGNIGDPIPAVVGGNVTKVGFNGGYGNQIVIESNGNKYYYNHLEGFNVEEGATVTAGDIIGAMGSTGVGKDGKPTSTGPHLDYRVQDANGEWIDPKTTFGTGSSGDGLYSKYLGIAKDQGLTGETAKEFANDQVKLAYTPMNMTQSAAYDAYAIMSNENKSYSTIVEALGPTELADAMDFVNREIKNDTALADAINQVSAGDLSSEAQQALMSEMRWTESLLRKKSGAAINVNEYKAYGRQYFPRPGDSQETIDAKAKSREIATQSMYDEMGPYGQRVIDESNQKSEEEQLSGQSYEEILQSMWGQFLDPVTDVGSKYDLTN